MTYDPRTKKINYAPVEEISKLRGKSLGSLSAVIAPTALPASSACDMEVHFAKPSGPVTFAVEVNGGTFYLDYTSDSQPAKVGFNATAEHAEFANWDSRGKPIGMQDEVTMLSSDTVISMRIFLDTNCGEVYFMGGRVAMTVEIPTAAYTAKVMASPSAKLLNATSWQMGSIWATKEEVLATPRLDGKN